MFKLNPEKIRDDFPILKQKVTYFDSACMSLKPKQVVDKMHEYYTEYTACSGRSIHSFSQRVEEEVDKARLEFAKFINCKPAEAVFTRNTTEGINLVANALDFKEGDEVIISDKEHNSNLIPWLKMKSKGVKLVIVPTKEDNTFDLGAFEKAFTNNTKLVSVVHTSNMDGVTNPLKDIVKITHQNGALCLADVAQSVPHKELDVKSLGVDFVSLSGHKMLGPTGTGILYGKNELLERLDQFMVGGDTVLNSTYDSYVPEHLPAKFEAGLQDYAGMLGLGEACRYLRKVGLSKVEKHEIALNKIITDGLSDSVSILGPVNPVQRGGIFSFIIDGIDIHHIAKMLDTSKKIMIRSGAHCVHSWFNAHNLKGSARASLYLYNTKEEAELFVDEVKKIIQLQ